MMLIQPPFKYVAVFSFTHRMGWANWLSTEFVLKYCVHIANSTTLSVLLHGYRDFQVVRLAAVCRRILKDSTDVNWAFMSSSYLDRCCELQQDPILSSRERRGKLSESRLINHLTVSVGLIQIINAAGAAECALVHVEDSVWFLSSLTLKMFKHKTQVWNTGGFI